MDKHVQPLAVEHKPGNKFTKLTGRELHLIHRLRVRTDGFVMATTEFHIKSFSQAITYVHRRVPRCRIVIHMRMKTLDWGGVIFHYFTQPYCSVWTVPGGYHHSPTLQNGQRLGNEPPRAYSGTSTIGFTAPSKVPSRVTFFTNRYNPIPHSGHEMIVPELSEGIGVT